MLEKIVKFFTISKIIFLTEVVVVFLTAFGVLPKEAVLFLTALLLFYFAFAPLRESFLIFIASVPLFVALPLGDSFDHMANWRLFAAAMFLVYLKEKGCFNWRWWVEKIKTRKLYQPNTFEVLALVFLGILILSLSVAGSLVLGIKEILFLVNIFLLYPITKHLLRQNAGLARGIFRAMIVATIVVLAIAFLQLAIVFFVPLFTFWQFWASGFIDVFYGSDLSGLLSQSNTWFAYYQAQPPTLRLFSVFPDSHSLAMFLIVALPALLFGWQGTQKKWFRGSIILLTFISFLAIVLSGSRGAWLSFLVALCLAGLIWLLIRADSVWPRRNFLILLLFLAAFGVSLLYPATLYSIQSYQGALDTDDFKKSLVFFERAKSISDTTEISNRGRIEIWDASLKSIAQRPFLGVGIGNFPLALGESLKTSKMGASAHNLYLDFGVEAGVLGAVLLAFLFLEILKMGWTVFWKNKSAQTGFWLTTLLVYFAWVLGYSLFDVVLLNDKVLLFFAVWLGAINYFYDQQQRIGTRK